MAAQRAIRPDIESLRAATQSEFALLPEEVRAVFDAMRQQSRSELEQLRSSMAISLGSMLFVGLSLLIAALKLRGLASLRSARLPFDDRSYELVGAFTRNESSPRLRSDS